jgi:DNA modification methylase
MPKHELSIENVRVELLQPNARNPRAHTKRQIRQIAASIREFSFTNPIITDDWNVIIAGHGRLEAAKFLGMEWVPVIRLAGLSEAQKRALVIADNKLTENAHWDADLLAQELQALVATEVDLEITGFDTPELDILLGNGGNEATSDESDELIEPERDAPPVTQYGDLWLLAKHRLLCGDALKPGSYEVLLGGELAEMVFGDPPYNVEIDGHAGGLGKTHHREFAMACGEMSSADFTAFLTTAMLNLARFSTDGSIHFICMDWRHLFELLSAARTAYSEMKNLCVWSKTNGGMGSLYRSQHELVGVFKSGGAPHLNNVELGRRGRYRTNLWHYAGVNSFRSGRMADLQSHPTVKPVALVADAVLDCSKVNGLILDPFAGSGTTILACERTKRRAAAIEIDPHYVDVAVRRFEKRTGIPAIHAETKLTFGSLHATRIGSNSEVAS